MTICVIASKRTNYSAVLFTALTQMVCWRLTSPSSTKIDYTGDKVLGGDLVLPG